jgi:NADPH:quinone reductase-like Zn-dependent oxidoreductase
MRAIAVDQFGGLASVHDVPIPEIGRDDVLVRVRAAAINARKFDSDSQDRPLVR